MAGSVCTKMVADDLFFFPQCTGELFPSRRETDLAAINVVKLLDGIGAAKETRCWSVGTGAAQVAQKISTFIPAKIAMGGSHKVPSPSPPRSLFSFQSPSSHSSHSPPGACIDIAV